MIVPRRKTFLAIVPTTRNLDTIILALDDKPRGVRDGRRDPVLP